MNLGHSWQSQQALLGSLLNIGAGILKLLKKELEDLFELRGVPVEGRWVSDDDGLEGVDGLLAELGLWASYSLLWVEGQDLVYVLKGLNEGEDGIMWSFAELGFGVAQIEDDFPK